MTLTQNLHFGTISQLYSHSALAKDLIQYRVGLVCGNGLDMRFENDDGSRVFTQAKRWWRDEFLYRKQSDGMTLMDVFCLSEENCALFGSGFVYNRSSLSGRSLGYKVFSSAELVSSPGAPYGIEFDENDKIIWYHFRRLSSRGVGSKQYQIPAGSIFQHDNGFWKQWSTTLPIGEPVLLGSLDNIMLFESVLKGILARTKFMNDIYLQGQQSDNPEGTLVKVQEAVASKRGGVSLKRSILNTDPRILEGNVGLTDSKKIIEEPLLLLSETLKRVCASCGFSSLVINRDAEKANFSSLQAAQAEARQQQAQRFRKLEFSIIRPILNTELRQADLSSDVKNLLLEGTLRPRPLHHLGLEKVINALSVANRSGVQLPQLMADIGAEYAGAVSDENIIPEKDDD